MMLVMIMVMLTTKLMMMVMVVVVIMMMVFRAFREAGSGQFKFQFEEEMGASQSHQTIQGQPPSALILWFSLLFLDSTAVSTFVVILVELTNICHFN